MEERIRARSIELVDDGGNARLILDGGRRGERGPYITLLDEEGTRRAVVWIAPNSAVQIQLLDTRERPSLTIGAGPLNRSDIPPEEKRLVEERLAELGLTLEDIEEYAAEFEVPETAEGSSIVLWDASGKRRAVLGKWHTGSYLALDRDDGLPGIMALAHEEASIAVMNEGEIATVPHGLIETAPSEPPAPSPQRGSSGTEFAGRRLRRWAAASAVMAALLTAGSRSASDTFHRLLRQRAGYYGERHP